MDYLLFVIGSTLEYFTLFICMLTLFRFRYRKRIVHIAFISLLMSQVSYFTRIDEDLGMVSTFIQLVFSVIVLFVVFRVAIHYSLLMNFASLALGFVVQGILLLIFQTGMGLSLETIQNNPYMAIGTQAVSAVLFLAILRTVRTFNLGFDFVPADVRTYERVTKTGAIMFAVIVLGMAAAFIAALLYRHNIQDYLYVTFAIFAVTLPTFLYYSFRKDEENAR